MEEAENFQGEETDVTELIKFQHKKKAA